MYLELVMLLRIDFAHDLLQQQLKNRTGALPLDKNLQCFRFQKRFFDEDDW